MKYFKFLVVFLGLGFGLLYLLFLLGESPGKAGGGGSGSSSRPTQLQNYLDTTFKPYVLNDTLWYKRQDTLVESIPVKENFKDETGSRFSLVYNFNTYEIVLTDSLKNFQIKFKVKKKSWSLIKKLKKKKKRQKNHQKQFSFGGFLIYATNLF